MGKFDKLIKENLSYFVKTISEHIGIDLKNGHLEIIKDKLQRTIEREPDFLFVVRHKNTADDYVVQFDFQAQNDGFIPERMLFYRSFIKFTHKLPVRQVVFYIGNAPLTMSDSIQEPNLFYKFELYDIRIFKSQSFLESNIPQEVLLAILGDFEGENPETIMEKILLRLQLLVKRKKDFQKFVFQLHVLSGLRKLHKIFQQKIGTMPIQFELDIRNDPFFIEGEVVGIEKGIEKGIAKKSYDFVCNLLLETDFPNEKIASLANVPLAFVEDVKKALERLKD